MSHSAPRVGDRVRVKRSVSEPAHGWGGVDHNSVGTVTSTNGNSCEVKFPEHSDWSGRLTEMECVDLDSGGRLTTGDAVVICSGASRAGQRGTIIKDDGPGDSQPYKVQFTDGDTHWYHAGEVAGVAAEEKATKIAEHQHTLTFTQRTGPRCDICGKACGRGAYTYCCAGCDFDACQECVASRRPSSIGGSRPVAGDCVEVVSGSNAGRTGKVVEDDGTSNPYKVATALHTVPHSIEATGPTPEPHELFLAGALC